MIKYLRNGKNMTQADLAEILGVTKNSIQKYESDSVPNIKADILKKLSETFGISPRAFIYPEELRNVDIEFILQNEKRLRNHIEKLLQLNEKGIAKVLSYTDDLIDSNNYKKD